jgi:hypothetical protein
MPRGMAPILLYLCSNSCVLHYFRFVDRPALNHQCLI